MMKGDLGNWNLASVSFISIFSFEFSDRILGVENWDIGDEQRARNFGNREADGNACSVP